MLNRFPDFSTSPSSSHRLVFSRRQALARTALSALGLSFLDLGLAPSLGAAERGATAPREPLNRFPRMVQEYFVERVRATLEKSQERKNSMQTKADAEAYVQSVREGIRASFGPAPEKTPLNPRVTGVVERDAYRIEKIIFESRPGLLVTSNLYVPKGRKFPLPGVVGSCGHSNNGKANEAYQSFAQGLARQGYVVLIFDPIGQGERLQYPNDELESRIGVGVREHLYAGNQQFLIGEFFGAWRAWDGIRALDYLLTREEVDPRHVGVTGNSGGGTLTTWLCGLDQRWTMAAPSCFVTSFLRNVENELPADTEQCPPRVLALGMDHEDFIAALAPKPVILLGKEKDYFDARGLEQAFRRLKRLYTLLGAEENIGLFLGPTYHGYSQENREAMYRWFNRVTGVSDQKTEPQLTIEKDKTLWCTPKGQVSELGARTVFSFTREAASEMERSRPVLTGAKLAGAVRRLLRLPERDGAPDYRIIRPIRSRAFPKNHFTTYAVATDPGIHALVYRLVDQAHYSRPPQGPTRAVLYVSHHSSDDELRSEPLVRELLAAEPVGEFYACDVRGIGESRPNTCGDNSFLDPYGNDYFYAIHSLMLDAPYVGQKTLDVLRVVDWLGSVGIEEVHLAAKGWGAIPAAFAALLADRIIQVTLKNALTSYADIAKSEDYAWPLSALLPGVLREFDLPACYRELAAGKKLRLVELWNAKGQPGNGD
jgi:dienelactone hydrolase